MKTDVVKPKDVFYNPTRLMVPLFQRPYVWSKDAQWAPLWDDIVRLIEVIRNHNPDATHFLGAIVIQQVPSALGGLPMWNVIDGQQRLTTLQVLLDALHGQLAQRGWDQLAGQILPLVENPIDYRDSDEDRFKLWPTNRDRDGFVAVMAAEPPVAYDALEPTRLRDAHRFFSHSIADWLGDDDTAFKRARTLVPTVLDRLEIASIRLDANEDAQAIFETLNARGTPLSAADLIKNFAFQNLDTTAIDAERAYLKYWAEFETPWWEMSVTTGRITNMRASLFLWQWLIARTQNDFPIREVFVQFKHYVNTVAKDIHVLLQQIRAAADQYRAIIEGSERPNGPLSRTELFSYRIAMLDSEIARPLIIWLYEPEQNDISQEDKDRILEIVESWLVRRALVKAPTQGMNRLIPDMIRYLKAQPRDSLPNALQHFLADNGTPHGYWPSDQEVRNALVDAKAYTRYRRMRLRMVLEALEDAKRGYPQGRQLAMGPVVRSKGTIEHLMPQGWRKNWPEPETEELALARDEAMHELGNLTLVTRNLNSKVSNGPWPKKLEYFSKCDDVLITKDAINMGTEDWDIATIHQRTLLMIDQILQIWPVPDWYTGKQETVISQAPTMATVDVAELVASGWIKAGAILRHRNQNPRWLDARAVVSQSGQIFIDDTAYETPSAAAWGATGKPQNGWWWWAVDETGQSLADVRADYLASMGEDDALDEESAADDDADDEVDPDTYETSTPNDAPVFELHHPEIGIKAIATELDGEFVVLAGSMARLSWAGSEHSYQVLRKSLEQDGTLALAADGKAMVFTHDQVFRSPSAAAAVVAGRNANGRLEWKIQGTATTYGEWQNSLWEDIAPIGGIQ